MSVADLCRREGFSSATVYKWRAKFGGMEASDAKRLRDLEHCPPGQACRFQVNSGVFSTTLPIKDEAGASYSLHVPSGQSWTDWGTDVDPLLGFNGGTLMNLLDSKRRLPNEPWFGLGASSGEQL